MFRPQGQYPIIKNHKSCNMKVQQELPRFLPSYYNKTFNRRQVKFFFRPFFER